MAAASHTAPSARTTSTIAAVRHLELSTTSHHIEHILRGLRQNGPLQARKEALKARRHIIIAAAAAAAAAFLSSRSLLMCPLPHRKRILVISLVFLQLIYKNKYNN